MPNAESKRLTGLLIALGRMLQEQMRRRSGPQTLSVVQLHALGFISSRERPLMRDLAARLRITPPSVTALVGGLARLKLIRRIPDKTDRRAWHLELTGRGRTVLRERLKIIAEGMQELTGVLSAGELKTFTSLMEKLTEQQ